MTLPRALLIDLDDTILSFSGPAEPAWRQVVEGFAPQLGLGTADLYAAIRRTADAFWAHPEQSDRGRLDLDWARQTIVGEALASLGSSDPEQARAIADTYTTLRDEAVAPFPGAVDALVRLRARHVRLAMVTNGSRSSQRAKIDRFDLEGHFDSIHIEEEVGAGKPDRRIFEAALRAVDVSRTDAWMIGDNLARDIAGAQALGIHAIWCDFRAQGLPPDTAVRPDRIVHSLAELLA